MFTKKMLIFYGVSVVLTVALFLILSVAIWKGYLLMILGCLFCRYYNKLLGYIPISDEATQPVKEYGVDLGV